MHFADTLAEAIDRCGAPACVGLDPVLEKIPQSSLDSTAREGGDDVEALGDFCIGVLNAVRDAGVAVVKPQSACFERHGAPGFVQLERVVAEAHRLGLLVILDAKRGDIGVSAQHYAAWVFDHLDAHAVTVSPYLGPDTLEPFVRDGRGMFVLVRTSNPESDTVQSPILADGRSIAELMADTVREIGDHRRGGRGLSDIGAVVGATKAAEAAALRRRMPDQFFLVPGFGAQGGTIDDVRRMIREGACTPGELGVVVNASRSVIYAPAHPGEPWQSAVRAAAESLVRELRELC
ncbi:MAG: orotidine-5'-phosphate decarboxylase [Phycisphaeraceae bacterium]|nr:orotidine-5'-phosphate decarboxylase [Phycisphaeraceae bacterium]